MVSRIHRENSLNRNTCVCIYNNVTPNICMGIKYEISFHEIIKYFSLILVDIKSEWFRFLIEIKKQITIYVTIYPVTVNMHKL